MTFRPPALVPLPALLALACLCAPAAAETSPWYLGVSQAFATDSNLYRIDDNVPLSPGFSRSDNISITSLVGGLDQPFGRQRAFGNATLSYNRFQNNSYLNDNSYSVTGGLDWSTVERLSGTVSLAGSQAQKRFNTDTAPGQVDTRKNNENIAQIDATFRAGVVTRLSLDAAIGYRRVDYSAPEWDTSEYKQPRASFGINYRPGIATFGASLSRSETTYSVTDDRHRRDALNLSAYWPANGVSSLYVRISPTRVHYDTFTERDFSGPTGAIKWDWQPTGKLNLTTRLVHDIGEDSFFESFGGPVVIGTSNTARTTTELRLTGDYELTGKVALNAVLSGAHRSLDQSFAASGQIETTGSGSDDTTTFSLGARWTPLRSVQLGCTVGIEKRSAKGGLTQDYSANTANCYAQLTLQ